MRAVERVGEQALVGGRREAAAPPRRAVSGGGGCRGAGSFCACSATLRSTPGEGRGLICWRWETGPDSLPVPSRWELLGSLSLPLTWTVREELVVPGESSQGMEVTEAG